MIKIIKKIFLLGLLSISIVFSTIASTYADETVEMLNKLNKEFMVYSKKVVKIKTGETIFWKATNAGHNVEFIKGGVPDGVPKFRSPLNKETEYKFEIPGIYAYWCTPHKTMGMIGFVVVGDDKSNLDAIKAIKFMGKSKKLAPDLINSL